MFTKDKMMRRDRNPSWRRVKSGPFHRIGDSYGHFFNPEHFMGRFPFEDPWLVPSPPANLKKDEDVYEVQMALPGFSRNEISIEVNGDILHIEAAKDDDYKDDFLAKEIHFDTQVRDFHLAENVNKDKIEATFEDGMLRVRLPYNGKTEKDERRSIEVL